MITKSRAQIAFVYGTQAGLGGLGMQSANAITGLAVGASKVQAFGPGHRIGWPLTEASDVIWHAAPRVVSSFAANYTPLRWRQGDLQYQQDSRLGRWAAAEIERLRPQLCYAFTQVGLETLRWAQRAGMSAILESPNGHIRNFRAVYEREMERWCGRKYSGHPNAAMVERVEEEYALADWIRVSSEWAKDSLIEGGVPARKIVVLQQPVNLQHFRPNRTGQRQAHDRLRVCFVGSLDLRKGFVYLLRAVKAMGARGVDLEFVGATGSRCCAQLLARESVGVQLTCQPGDPLNAYQRADVFVLPTLEDGSPFAVAEAMACGLPVIVTDSCGSAEWVRTGRSGWVVPAGRVQPLATALSEALARRHELREMGALALADTERRAGADCFTSLNQWAESTLYQYL